MTTPGKGRADFLDLGDWNTMCYECGRKRKASYMVKNWQGYYVCPEHNEPRQPQDFVRGVPDSQNPPWVQPMPATDTYATVCMPNDRSAIPGNAIPNCVIPNFIAVGNTIFNPSYY